MGANWMTSVDCRVLPTDSADCWDNNGGVEGVVMTLYGKAMLGCGGLM